MIRRFPLAVRSLCAVWLLLGMTVSVSAQGARPKQHQHETLLLDIDSTATKKFSTVQTHLRVGQLPEAVELLRNISDAHVGKLVATTPGRYVNVQTYVQMLAAGLPPDGLKIYRQQLDPALKPTFETARDNQDETLLLKVLQQGYCCSFSDEALLLLGDMAWDAGDVWRARSFWEQLLPPPRPKALGEPVLWLAYPDSDLDLGLIVGRLILCTIQSGDRLEIQRELAGYAERYPAAEGHLAGRQGNLSEILSDVAAEDWPIPVQTSVVQTFAGSPQRYHIDTQAAKLGSLRWQASLRPFGEEQRRGFQPGSQGGLCYFPVVYGDVVFVNDDEQIYAYRLQTGQPAWSGDPTEARVYWSELANRDGIGVPRGAGEAPVGNVGLPRFTMTIADGRLYARMGSVQPYSSERSGWLVCLDLAQSEGKLVWETFASSIDPEVGGWSFEGSPLVVGGRVYVGMRRTNPQPQSNVACFDSLTGKLIWNRKLCVGQTNPNFPEFDINQHLLTWGEGTLFFATHMGAVAALDPRSGTIKWIVSYPRVDDTKMKHEYTARLQRGPLPAMFADGVLYVAPIDSDELLAFDAETGLVKWRRTFNSPIRSLLGVSNGIVFASGAGLWGIAAESGKIVWKVGDPDPETHGFGRGLLVEDAIYWPTHEEIFIIEQATGAIRQRLPLFAVHGQYGGNLLLTEHHLLVAQPGRLAVFSDHGLPPPRSKSLKPQYTRQKAPAARAWKLARDAVEMQNWGQAADQFRAASQLARPNDEWMGHPLAEVAADREIDARLRHAWELTATDATAAPKVLNVALDAAASRDRSLVQPDLQQNQNGSERPLAGDRPMGQISSRIEAPRSTPQEMLTWVSAQLAARTESTAAAHGAGAVPILERTTAYQDVFHRVTTSQRSPILDEAALVQALTAAEQLVDRQPDEALTRLRELAGAVHSSEDRVRVWCGLARSLESRHAWTASAAAWKQAARSGPPNQMVADLDRQVSIRELISERLERPQYLAQSSLTANEGFPWPLRRHWELAGAPHSHAVYPIGVPPAIDAACVLIDRSPLTCVNLADGTARWQLRLSHPVLWAGFAAEKLILATAAEVRAVSVTTGETVWWQRVREEPTTGPSHQLISLHMKWDAKSLDGSDPHPLLAAGGNLHDFALIGDTFLARQGSQDIVAWDVNQGCITWRFSATRGLSAGWGLTARHVVIGQLAPDNLIVLDRTDGSEVARFPTDAANWMRSPEVRDDGTLMTVGPLGRIESWSKPGAAWLTDEGPRAWLWPGTALQSKLPPEVLTHGRTSLLLMDGKMLTAVDSVQGNILWKAFLGLPLIENDRAAICCDDDRIYVASNGFLQALGMQDGSLLWKCYLGADDLPWRAHVSGATVMAYPTRTGRSELDAPITVCDAATGAYLQRISLPASPSPVQVYPTSHTTLVACGGTLIGLGK
ncbi:MAG: PQQ-binding-like beta-propeller repeat protein [Planctomycetota bacterium]